MVSVALDTGGAEAAGPWIDRAKATHPALIDEAHLLDELLGIVNVPSGIWIDEEGMIVRPPEPAFPWRPRQPSEELLAQLPALMAEQLREAQKIRIDPESYVAALRDWVENGDESRYALTPEEVVAAQRPRDDDQASAAACFELAQHLQRLGHPRTPSRGSVRPTASSPRTGPTSDRRGRSRTRSRGPPTTTTPTG